MTNERASEARKPKKRPVGRPPKADSARKRNILSMRVRDDLRAKLARSAESSQRSVSEEAEFRLEQSFRDDRVLEAIEQMTNVLTNADQRVAKFRRKALNTNGTP